MPMPSEPSNVAAAPEETVATGPGRAAFSLRPLLTGAIVWLLYVPYLGFLRLVGPRVAVRIGRLTAWLHWLLTFVGAQGRTRRAMERNYKQFETPLPVRSILRKYLEVKHHQFVIWHLCTHERGRRFVDATLRAFDGQQFIESSLAARQGAIVLGYHFGSGPRIVTLTLTRKYKEDAYDVAFRPEIPIRGIGGFAARIVRRVAIQCDEKSGVKHIYLSPNSQPLAVVRHLRQGHFVGLAGDGFFASKFCEVPFLGGTMRFPIGVARLAAMSKVPILVIFGLVDGLESHRVILHAPIQCDGASPAELEKCVRACCAVLEQYVRRNPWAWWIWHRLEFSEDEDGRTRITASAAPFHSDDPAQPAGAAVR